MLDQPKGYRVASEGPANPLQSGCIASDVDNGCEARPLCLPIVAADDGQRIQGSHVGSVEGVEVLLGRCDAGVAEACLDYLEVGAAG
jgi:hypothetical protein